MPNDYPSQPVAYLSGVSPKPSSQQKINHFLLALADSFAEWQPVSRAALLLRRNAVFKTS